MEPDHADTLAALQRDASAAHLQALAASRSLKAACAIVGHALEQVAEDLSEALRLTRRLAATHQRMLERLAGLSSNPSVISVVQDDKAAPAAPQAEAQASCEEPA